MGNKDHKKRKTESFPCGFDGWFLELLSDRISFLLKTKADH